MNEYVFGIELLNFKRRLILKKINFTKQVRISKK